MVTIEPQRYFTEEIAGFRFETESLVPSGVSPETYDPAPQQMLSVSRSRAFFYIGSLGFETAWIDKLKANNKNVAFFRNDINISTVNAENEESHSEHHISHGAGDPHVWASPKNVLIMADNICRALKEIDPENEETYSDNTVKFKETVNEIDKEIRELLKDSRQKSFIIFHPSLTYFARDYGLTQYAIELEGKEPSAEHLKHIIDIANRDNISTIFIQQEFDVRNAELVAAETQCRIVKINPLSYNWKAEMINIAKALSE
jgi:zinc transport system substrate-binding protein